MNFLDGVRVVDTTQVLAGPVVTMHLGDLGAEVVKVERPDGGDISRGLPPHVGDTSSQYVALNRNKHSVAVDLRTERGREILHELVGEADVFVENYKRGTPERLGIDYETLASVNPDLVYCSIKGFDSGSIYEDNPAYDMVAQAMGGLMSITGQPDGPPAYVGAPVGDLAAAMYAIQSILGALFHRSFQDAGGEFLEVSMLDAIVAWLGVRLTASGVEGEPYPRLGNRHPNVAPYRVFETADGYVVVAVVGENAWAGLCDAVDRPDLREDPRFATSEDRVEHQEALYAELDGVFRARPTEEWFAVLQDHGVPTGPVRDTIEVLEDPYTEAQDLIHTFVPPSADQAVPVVRYPATVGGKTADSPRPPPDLGADTATYLEALGYSAEEIDSLASSDVVHVPD